MLPGTRASDVMVAIAFTAYFSVFWRGTRAAIRSCMKLLAAATLALTTSLLATTARADDVPAPPQVVEHHVSKGAHTAGVALTVTGVTFFGLGGVASAGAIFTLLGGFGGGDNFGPLVGAALFGMAAGGFTVLGLSTFIPGIVLMNDNAPRKMPDLQARRPTVPAPSFTTFPIVSATF